jgi:hypothetical protein
MYVIVNRLAAIIKPKQPLLDWLKSQPDWDLDITLEELRADRYALLIPGYAFPDQALRYIERNHKAIFELELFGWYTDESVWPKKRTLSVFRKWFDVEIHSMVIDMLDEHIMREEYNFDLL